MEEDIKTLFEELRDIHCQHQCGCSHLACNQRKEDTHTKVVLTKIALKYDFTWYF
jgi:hypothetical protein